jgi:hypothetical protein
LSKVQRRFFQTLWPSQKTQTLCEFLSLLHNSAKVETIYLVSFLHSCQVS